MQLTCVLFCLETNTYISNDFFDDHGDWIGKTNLVKEWQEALHFENRQEAIDFLTIFEKEIVQTCQKTCFTPREYFKLKA